MVFACFVYISLLVTYLIVGNSQILFILTYCVTVIVICTSLLFPFLLLSSCRSEENKPISSLRNSPNYGTPNEPFLPGNSNL